jgi:hypothetical protein
MENIANNLCIQCSPFTPAGRQALHYPSHGEYSEQFLYSVFSPLHLRRDKHCTIPHRVNTANNLCILCSPFTPAGRQALHYPPHGEYSQQFMYSVLSPLHLRGDKHYTIPHMENIANNLCILCSPFTTAGRQALQYPSHGEYSEQFLYSVFSPLHLRRDKHCTIPHRVNTANNLCILCSPFTPAGRQALHYPPRGEYRQQCMYSVLSLYTRGETCIALFSTWRI